MSKISLKNILKKTFKKDPPKKKTKKKTKKVTKKVAKKVAKAKKVLTKKTANKITKKKVISKTKNLHARGDRVGSGSLLLVIPSAISSSYKYQLLSLPDLDHVKLVV